VVKYGLRRRPWLLVMAEYEFSSFLKSLLFYKLSSLKKIRKRQEYLKED
jgi:hypothetical protein